MKKILILANDVTTILQFRCELIYALVKEGNEVIVSVPESDRITEIESLGATVVKTKVSRHGKNPFKDLRLKRDYVKLLKDIKPDIVLTFTVKPNAYGGMACSKMKIPYIANITGLGVVGNKGILQKITLWLYKKGLKKARCVFFQNSANKEFFESKNIVGTNARLLPGSGVNVEKFSYLEYPKEEKVNLLFIGRIIRDKGVYELAEAAKVFTDVKFTILGTCEYGSENPFEKLHNAECVGYNKDVRPFIEKAHAVILPSAYHEGMSNVLLEGASSGRPILATTIPGCKETFDEGITGFGFEQRNAQDTIRAISEFLKLSQEEKKEMGIRGREKMVNQFNKRIIIEKYFEEIQEKNDFSKG